MSFKFQWTDIPQCWMLSFEIVKSKPVHYLIHNLPPCFKASTMQTGYFQSTPKAFSGWIVPTIPSAAHWNLHFECGNASFEFIAAVMFSSVGGKITPSSGALWTKPSLEHPLSTHSPSWASCSSLRLVSWINPVQQPRKPIPHRLPSRWCPQSKPGWGPRVWSFFAPNREQRPSDADCLWSSQTASCPWLWLRALV